MCGQCPGLCCLDQQKRGMFHWTEHPVNVKARWGRGRELRWGGGGPEVAVICPLRLPRLAKMLAE